MNDRGPRRFSKYMDGVSVKDFLLTLTQEKFEGINQRFADLKESIIEARRGMENRMAGFPSEFAQKGDMNITAASLKELKDKDLKELKTMIEAKITRGEYNQQHAVLSDKIDRLNEELNGLKNERANIQGRIVATGGILVLVIAAVQVITTVIIHIYFGKP